MTLQLDARQRAMLQEMGVQVWLPGTEFAVQAPSAAAVAGPQAASSDVLTPATTPAPTAVRPPPLAGAVVAPPPETAAACRPLPLAAPRL